MTLEVIGANHRTSPLELRERLAVPAEGLVETLRRLSSECRLGELAIISTCNRVEFYFREAAGEHLGHYLAAAAGLSRDAIMRNVYHLKGTEAVRHLFSVAAGLDSMALGETEVLAQCKCAYEAALTARTTGCVLNCLFQRAFSAAKRVHSMTGISKGRTSVGSVSADLIRRELGGLDGRTVLVIGAGMMAENALTHIAALGAARIIVANRSPERGKALAERFRGQALGLGDLKRHLSMAEVVITSTAGKRYLLTRAMLSEARKRRSKPLVVLDLSVPRNVEPAAGGLAGVRLFNIDDLKVLADSNRAIRKRELDRAQAVIDEEAAAFTAWLAQRQVVPVVRRLKEKAHRLQEREVEAALRNLRRGAAAEDEIRKLAKRLTAQFLHEPLSALKAAAADGGEAEALSRAARVLHGIEDNGQSEESRR